MATDQFGSSEAGKKGGRARAKRLTKEQRSEIARRAAVARWGGDEKIPQATHGSTDRPLKIGNVEIPCYVLDDGTRVLSQRQFLEAVGRHPKANVRREGDEEQLPAILQGKSINPFITKELVAKSKPIRFRTTQGVILMGQEWSPAPLVVLGILEHRPEIVLQ